MVDVLRACHPSEVLSRSVSIQVLITTIIAIPPYVLCRGIYAQPMFLIGRKIIELQATAINGMP